MKTYEPYVNTDQAEEDFPAMEEDPHGGYYEKAEVDRVIKRLNEALESYMWRGAK